MEQTARQTAVLEALQKRADLHVASLVDSYRALLSASSIPIDNEQQVR
jgi:hypothetical protein